MHSFVRTALIDAPVAEVWTTLADFGGISAWAPNVDHSCLMAAGPIGVGLARRIQSGPTTVVETIQVFEPGVALAYSIAGLPPVVRSVTNGWRLGASGVQTMVTLTTEIDTGPRPPQQVVARGIGRVLGKASDDMLQGLADHLVRSAGEGVAHG